MRLRYGGTPYVVDVLAYAGGLLTGDAGPRGVLRFRLERVEDAQELPSSDPLF